MPPGSLLTSRGDDSEEDENTEYFDAMEDSASFITVTTEPSEDRCAAAAPPWRLGLSALGVFFSALLQVLVLLRLGSVPP